MLSFHAHLNVFVATATRTIPTVSLSLLIGSTVCRETSKTKESFGATVPRGRERHPPEGLVPNSGFNEVFPQEGRSCLP
jgi:hypothetical protein